MYAKKHMDANKTQVPGIPWALSPQYQILSEKSNMEEGALLSPSLSFPILLNYS